MLQLLLRRCLIGGVLGLSFAAAGIQLSTSGCNEPLPTDYGNPNTLDRRNLPGEGGAEPFTCGGEAGTGGAFDGGCPSFAADIYPYLKADGKWQCSNGVCHGGAMSPAIDGTDPAKCLASLRAVNLAGKPYVPGPGGSTDPTASAILCNLQGSCGSRMPKAPGADPTGADMCMLEAWLKCGAPP